MKWSSLSSLVGGGSLLEHSLVRVKCMGEILHQGVSGILYSCFKPYEWQ
jgi:hypothetical protein